MNASRPPRPSAGQRRRVLRPNQVRVVVAACLVVFSAALDITHAIVLSHSTLGRWVFALVWLATVPLLWYAWGMARPLVVRPGASVQWRSILGARRSVQVDASLEVVWFTNVEGTSAMPIRPTQRVRATPNGVVDQRWAIVRSQGRTVVRLSGWAWSKPLLIELARVAPAQLKLRPSEITNAELLEQYPDYYTWVERHPGLEVVLLLVAVFASAAPIITSVVTAFALITTFAPAP